MPGNKKLFLSVVSSEFVSHRNLLAADLKRPNLDVAVQEDFVVTGGSTLEKLDTYIVQCDAVIHLIGKATGGVPVYTVRLGFPGGHRGCWADEVQCRDQEEKRSVDALPGAGGR